MQNSLRALFGGEEAIGIVVWSGFRTSDDFTTSFYRWGIKSPGKTGDLPKASQLAGGKTRRESVVL